LASEDPQRAVPSEIPTLESSPEPGFCIGGSQLLDDDDDDNDGDDGNEEDSSSDSSSGVGGGDDVTDSVSGD
jgi:hypothetical protein